MVSMTVKSNDFPRILSSAMAMERMVTIVGLLPMKPTDDWDVEPDGWQHPQ